MSAARSHSVEYRTTLFAKLRAAAAISCLLVGTAPSWAQVQQQSQPVPAATGLPPEPAPNYTQPLFLHDTNRDFSKPRGYFPNLIAPYEPTTLPAPSFLNSLQLDNLIKDGKIYLSLSDAVLLALQNNYDIAVQRLNLDIADTDILRTKAGQLPQGTSTSLVSNTLGGSGSAVTSGGGPGGSSVAGTGAGGIAVSTSGAGPAPENLDPTLTGTIQLQRQKTPQVNLLFSGNRPFLTTNTDEYNFTYNQGFRTGTALQVGFQNQRVTSDSPLNIYSPSYTTTFNAQLTQHLLQGFGWGLNSRFIVQATNNRRIADSVFRSQLLYTINQVEDIYWGLVGAFEDVQSKQRALDQSTSLEKDDEKQLQIGSMAPLDVVNAKSSMFSDQQALIASQSNLEYQQLTMKQAIARNLDDPRLANAPVIPTDRVSLAETPEEHASADDLVREAEANSPAIEQAILNMKNDEITLKAAKNGLLPTLDAYAFYGAQGLGGIQSPDCVNFFTGAACPTSGTGYNPPIGYGTTVSNLFNSTGPNKGAGFNLNIPIRNRPAQALQARSQIEYRQAQMRLQQLYVQIRMQVINDQYALTNDRAAVNAAEANQDYNRQSLDAEVKKLHLGASTTANVLQQQRSLASADAQLISARARYATDRAALEEALASTLDRYGISIVDAATGQVHTPPVIPGLEPAKSLQEVQAPTQKQQLQQQEQQPQPQTGNQPQPQG
ncbi:MAG TPA: TolC family protein [Acidobacteriaceae bacterium]|jgi:outer membrane protein TolC|nr:TolC family protein [Acidobacteriaceae bacterium]